MPHVITVIAYPRDFGIWKMRISGITDNQFHMLRSVNPLLQRKTYGTFLTAKWRTQGAGHGRFLPMSYITPVLNILEEWGYCMVSVNDMEKSTGLGKIWTFRMNRCSPYLETMMTARYLQDRYQYFCLRYPTLANYYYPCNPCVPACGPCGPCPPCGPPCLPPC